MKIVLDIPNELSKDYTLDKFKEFFSRVIADINNEGLCGNYEKEIAEMFIKAFDNSKERDGWISCGEKMPEDGKEVLVWYEYFRYGDYNCMWQTFGIGYQINGFWSGDVQGYRSRCIAWMPLPEPYKEGGV